MSTTVTGSADADEALRSRVEDAIAELQKAGQAYDEACRAVADVGESDLKRIADACDRATGAFARLADDAVGSGDFEAYVALQGEIAAVVDDLPDDVAEREAFEAASDALDRRRLRERDIEAARDALEPAHALASRLDEREAARERYVEARSAAETVRDAVTDRIAELERLADVSQLDLDAPIDELRAPIEAYDAAVRDAFDSLVGSAPSRSVLALLDRSASTPLVPAASPPADLRRYLDDAAVGGKPIPRLLDLLDQTRSKRDHYVDDPSQFAAVVGPARTELEDLSADPFTIGWPPPPATVLWWRGRELVPLVDRFAPAETVHRLRSVRRLARDDRYPRLRSIAVARDDLSADDIATIDDGIAEPLAARRDERERLDAALEANPPVERR